MKGSDVEREIAQRNGATVVTEIPLGTKLSDRNAKKVFSGVTDYRATRIIQTQGAAESESRAYGRDAILDKFDRRKKLQRALDQMMSDAGMSEAEAQPFRDALERELDEDDPEDEEESEDEEPAEDEPTATGHKWLHDALDQLLGMDRKRKAVVAKDRSVAMDAAPKKKICCVDCASLDGIKGFRQAQRAYEASRAHLI
jgi:hypothetical protein